MGANDADIRPGATGIDVTKGCLLGHTDVKGNAEYKADGAGSSVPARRNLYYHIIYKLENVVAERKKCDTECFDSDWLYCKVPDKCPLHVTS
jgi:hypothetical protein